MKGTFYSGTSNIVLPVSNKTFFPEAYREQTRLRYYASLFNSLEVNSSFYKIPLARTISKWATEVPDDFRFSFKISKEVTHTGRQEFNLHPVPKFLERIKATDKKGCLLIQLPPKFSLDIFQLTRLAAALRTDWKLVIEFRHSSWYVNEVYQLLNGYDIAMVLHDMPGKAAPFILTSDKLIYQRFHGPEKGYRGSYGNDVLAEYAIYINEWLAAGKTVYIYFNNTLGNAVQNLFTLNQFVQHG